jgi:ATP-dependent phosphofructokinase / diphosphate-dependent phosphofructokinase
MAGKRILVVTGGGDCPGLNAVIRAIVRRASQEYDWEVVGSINAYNGILKEPMELVLLDARKVAGIHVMGGTIIGTTNKGGPFAWPVKQPDGTWTTVDRSDDLLKRLQYQGIDAVISIGGDGSQKISQQLFEKGLNIVGVPKTIDNDLSSTDFTFGYQTAVEIATEAVDRLVTTASSHHRVMILEVMGRGAGWIALSAALAGGAEIVLIPEIPYNIKKVVDILKGRISRGKGHAIIVIAEGAKAQGGSVVASESDEAGRQDQVLGGIGYVLQKQIKALLDVDTRVTVLGHLQRGGSPISYDRILATQFGVKAVEMVKEAKFGYMVSYRHPHIVSVPLKEAIANYNFVSLDHPLVKAAQGIGISLGI